MSTGGQTLEIELVPLRLVVEDLHRTRVFADISAELLMQALAGVDNLERVSARAGDVLVETGEAWRFFWLVLDGETRAERPETDGSLTLVGVARARRRFWRDALSERRRAVKVSDYGDAGLAADPVQGAGVLEAAGLLPGGAQNCAGRYGAAAAGLPGRGAASREAGFAGDDGWRV